MLGIFSVDVWCLHVSEYSDITDSVMQSCCKECRGANMKVFFNIMYRLV